MTALIIDPDNLVDPTSIAIDVGNKKIQLIKAGNLGDEGVTIKCVYSKLKELWKSDTTYIKYPFPMGPITDEQFEMVNGWDWKDNTTRYLLRTGGWAVKDLSGVSLEEWAGIVSLGSIDSDDQAYFLQSDTVAVSGFQLTGPINQAIKVYGDGSHGSIDYRGYLKIYCRIYQKSYAFSQISDIGVASLTYQAYRFPLANAADIKITHNDAAMSGVPYSGMDITWSATPVQRDIGGTNRDFHVIIDGNNATAEQIYEYVQYQLRQVGDIDAGAGEQLGQKTGTLLNFVGDTLYTNEVTEGGVFIDNYLPADINRLVFIDDLGESRTFPYTAVLTLNFGDNLKNDPNAKYWVYFTNDDAGSNAGYDYGTSDAILVEDASEITMTAGVSGASSVQLTFAYDTNEQRGNTAPNESPADDALITCVAIGLSTGQFVKATGTIAKSTANSVSLVAPLERNYSNPA